jgi:D-amino-acid dehydrogenase
MVEQSDVVVVGGGIVGTAAAFHLAERGVDTLLVDDGRAGSATAAGAGIISPPTSSRRDNDDWFAFAVEAAAHYPTLIDRLETRGIDDHSYLETEMLSVALTEAEAGTLEEDRERAARRGARLEEIPPEVAQEAFPALADVEMALRLPDAARVDGASITSAIRRAAKQSGLTTLDAVVEEILVEDGAAAGVVVDGGGRIDADSVVVAGGAWSGGFGDDLDLSLPVCPTRGQLVHLDASEDAVFDDMADLPIVGSVSDNYIVPWADDRIVVGATREEDAGFDAQTTAGGVHEVLDAGLRLAPGLDDATLNEVRVGLRPGSPDGLPILGPVPAVEGAYVATGHGPTGLTLGPYSGEVIAQLIGDEQPAVDLSAFDPDRF